MGRDLLRKALEKDLCRASAFENSRSDECKYILLSWPAKGSIEIREMSDDALDCVLSAPGETAGAPARGARRSRSRLARVTSRLLSTPSPRSLVMRLTLPRLSPSLYRASSRQIATPAQIGSLISHTNGCSCHHCHAGTSSSPAASQASQLSLVSGLRGMATVAEQGNKEYAFEVSPNLP
jgi:hypothetical protein